ncbi:SRPBCC family protein [Ornithinimicrobium avium]|uniref:Activator of Hsp90 ATPase homologue 1/2-like C-terminal domain-containing protein n=1 Tax=Ornithinimicrobium avium TaxID=2283195 RepID=A0A345NMD9_9MICO|nr:SRPBCC family protein [Ornithinimicrobium avium]AXH96197.1 hypothetical protein DV701_08675 [Ornithinimicrobium avium]
MSAPTEESTTELVLTRTVDATPEQVWTAWTTPGGLARWWWPHWQDTAYEMEARAGGRWSARSAEGDTGVEGEVLTVEQPRLLELSWAWAGEAAQDRVRVELTEHDGRTLVTVRHRTRAAGVDDYRAGWELVLANLASTLAPRGPELNRLDELPGPQLFLSQMVAAPAADVYAAWLDPDLLATWWWPEHPDTRFEIDAREGGRFRIWSERAGLRAEGTYLHLGGTQEPAILMTWAWGAGEQEDLVHVGFTDLGGDSTLVELTHAMAVESDGTDSPRRGWSAVLGSLTERLGGPGGGSEARRPPGRTG